MNLMKLIPAWVLLSAVFGEVSALRAQQAPDLGNLIPAVRRARQATIAAELDQLSQAFQAYQEKYLVYPPCLLDSDPDERKTRLMRHLAAVWPRSNYGGTAADYDALKQKVASDWKYDFVDAHGRVAPLDLDRLDPAEAIVFWLAGFPTPVDPATKQPITQTKSFGFHRDIDNPFKRTPAAEESDPTKFRSSPFFDYRVETLVDKDQDGWLEYLPAYPKDDPDCAPFVYFDAATYAETTKNAERLGTCLFPRDPALAKRWGVAAPYLESFNAAEPSASVWVKKNAFQIIAGGLDGRYGLPGDGAKPSPRLLTVRPLKVLQAADRFAVPRDVDAAGQDNLVNIGMETVAELKP